MDYRHLSDSFIMPFQKKGLVASQAIVEQDV
jgi:hypothetical protein